MTSSVPPEFHRSFSSLALSAKLLYEFLMKFRIMDVHKSLVASLASWVSIVTRYGLDDCSAGVPGRVHSHIDPGGHVISFRVRAGV